MTAQDCLSRECAQGDKPISSQRIPRLRLAIQSCRLSFPAQVPAFARESRADIQWRMAALYFLRGWSCEQLGRRYGLTNGRVRQQIRKWVENAAAVGYLQWIPQEAPIAVGFDPSWAAVSAIRNATAVSRQNSVD